MDSQSTANEEEVAACLAVLALLNQQEKEKQRQLDQQSILSKQPATKAWQVSSRLSKQSKGSLLSVITRHRTGSAWKLSSRLLLLLSFVLSGHYGNTGAALASEPTIKKLEQAKAVPPPLPLAAPLPGSAEAAPLPPFRQEQGSLLFPTAISASPASRNIRVGLVQNSSSLTLQLPDGAQILDEATGELLAELPPLSNWKISTSPSSFRQGNTATIAFSGNLLNVDANQVMLAKTPSPYQAASLFTPRTAAIQTNRPEFKKAPYILAQKDPQFWLPVKLLPPMPSFSPDKTDNTRKQIPTQAPAKVSPLKSSSTGYRVIPIIPDGIIGVNGKLYRGDMLLLAGPGAVTVINDVSLENYLLSVVASEMPSGWPVEALKAQAVAARSYALANLGKNGSQGFDVKATIEDQVYLGIQAEKESSNNAVRETAGLILKHEGQPITAFFHSSSGGHTDLSEHLWSKKTPYLKAVPDYDNDSPHFAWTKQYTVESMEESLRKAGKDPGALMTLLPITRSPAQRVSQLLIAGSLQTTLLTGEDMRKVLSLPSSVFNVNLSAKGYIFAGRGWGHGLGMSQWGAKALAEKGFNCAEILSYYYKDVILEAM